MLQAVHELYVLSARVAMNCPKEREIIGKHSTASDRLTVHKYEHIWLPTSRGVFCARCRTLATSRHLYLSRRATACHSFIPGQSSKSIHGSHQVLSSSGFLWCLRCGSCYGRRMHKLKEPCSPPKRSGIDAINRLSKGLHPDRHGRRGHDVWLGEPVPFASALNAPLSCAFIAGANLSPPGWALEICRQERGSKLAVGL